jgi:hypothetical protein
MKQTKKKSSRGEEMEVCLLWAVLNIPLNGS